MRGGLAAAVWLVALGPAAADCDHFKWSVAAEKGWLARGAEPVEPGATVAVGDRAYELTLKPEAAAAFVLAPKKSTPGAFGATLHFFSRPSPASIR